MIDNEAAAREWIRAMPECDQEAFDRLECLVALLRDENSRQNLVSASSLDYVWQRHIADSAQLLRYVPRETKGSWLDLGTGAGFPGIVIAALRPHLEIIMVEARNRRVDWLRRACNVLGLRHADVAGEHLEHVETKSVDVISARAFAPLSRLLSSAARFSTSTTLWLLPKGRSAAQELQELRDWDHTFHVEPSLTNPEAGIVVGKLAGRKGVKP